MAEALYRKYRPQIFEDVVGQEHIERTIKNAIEQDKVSHAYLFCGPRGTGKTTTARLLAKALLCEQGPTAEPDGTCEMCELVAKGEHPDVYELDAASRTGVENVREEIIGRVHYAPTRGRYKIYIIDEVHMLSVPAFNALLKTLEEPPAHVVFILATTDPQKVPETIHSRCQRFDFHRIAAEAIVSRLGAICVAEGVECDPEALDLIAHRADGGMRNALTSLEQLIVFCGGNITLDAAERMLGGSDSEGVARLMRAVGAQDAGACFRFVDEFAETGSDVASFVRDMAQFARNLYVMSLAGAGVELSLGSSERRELEAVLPLFGPDRISRMLGVLGDLQAELKTSTNQRLSLEIALTRMVRPQSDLTMEALAQRLETLERGFAALSAGARGGAAAGAVSAAAAVAPQVPTQQPTSARTYQQPAPATFAGQGAAGSFGGAPAGAPNAGAPHPAAVAPQAAQAARSAAPAAGVSAPAAAPAASQAATAPTPQGFGTVAPPAASTPASAGQAAAPAVAQATASSPAPAAQAATAPSLSNPAVVQRLWQSVLGAARSQGGGLATFLGWASAVYDPATGGIAAVFDGSQQFVYNQVHKPENVRFVAQALQTAFGRPVPFAFALGAPAPAMPSAPSVQAAVPSASAPAPQPFAAPSAPAFQQPFQAQAGPAAASQSAQVPQVASAPSPAAAVAQPQTVPTPQPAQTMQAATGRPPVSAPAASGTSTATPSASSASTPGASAPATSGTSAASGVPASTPTPASAAAPVASSASAAPATPSASAPAMAMPAEPPDTTSAASAARNAASAAAAPADQGAEYLQSVLAAGGFGDSITVSEVTDN